MDRSQRIGWLIVAAVLMFVALLAVGGIASHVALLDAHPEWGNIGRLMLNVGIAIMAAVALARGLRRGHSGMRWLLFVVLLLSAGFFAYLGTITAAPLPDATEQARWEQSNGWMAPATFTAAAACFVGAVLLLTPPVGAIFRYWRERSAAACG